MAFELDPVFHTETMVKILQAQGHLSLAAKVLDKVMEKSPGNPRMISLRESLKNGSRENFDRPSVSSTVVVEDETTDPGTPVEEFAVADPESGGAEDEAARTRQEKLEKLNLLLQKVQERS